LSIESKIENSHLLTDIFGRWPSFHDAEVLNITLDRGERGTFEPSLQAAVHVFEGTSQVDDEGERRYVLKNHVVVRMRFSRIGNLSLADFNQQNVLWSLKIEHLSDRPRDKVKFAVIFHGTFGATAKFHCDAVSIESVEPYSRERR